MSGIGGYGGRRLATMLGPAGVWSWALQRLGASDAGAAARGLEAIGYPAVWIPETLGNKEVFSHAAVLLAATQRIAVASGIANIHARDPMAMANGARTLGEAYPGRFILGIGVSHAPSVATRGGTYGPPLETMRAYLDAMAAAPYGAPEPAAARPGRARGARATHARARRRARRWRAPLLRPGRARSLCPPASRPGAVPRRGADGRAHHGPRRGAPDRARLREELPRPSELREQPAAPRLGRRGPRRDRERPPDRRGHRLWRRRRDRRAGPGPPRRRGRQRVPPAAVRFIVGPGPRRPRGDRRRAPRRRDTRSARPAGSGGQGHLALGAASLARTRRPSVRFRQAAPPPGPARRCRRP